MKAPDSIEGFGSFRELASKSIFRHAMAKTIPSPISLHADSDAHRTTKLTCLVADSLIVRVAHADGIIDQVLHGCALAMATQAQLTNENWFHVPEDAHGILHNDAEELQRIGERSSGVQRKELRKLCGLERIGDIPCVSPFLADAADRKDRAAAEFDRPQAAHYPHRCEWPPPVRRRRDAVQAWCERSPTGPLWRCGSFPGPGERVLHLCSPVPAPLTNEQRGEMSIPRPGLIRSSPKSSLRKESDQGWSARRLALLPGGRPCRLHGLWNPVDRGEAAEIISASPRERYNAGTGESTARATAGTYTAGTHNSRQAHCGSAADYSYSGTAGRSGTTSSRTLTITANVVSFMSFSVLDIRCFGILDWRRFAKPSIARAFLIAHSYSRDPSSLRFLPFYTIHSIQSFFFPAFVGRSISPRTGPRFAFDACGQKGRSLVNSSRWRPH